MAPFVSVVIPTHNRKTLLRRSVESVLAQTYRDFELIVVDDGSNDGTCTPAYFGDMADQCSYVRLDMHYGVSKARNAGAARSTGLWLAFLDSDDVWKKSKLEKQVAWVKKNPSFRIVQTREEWVRRGKRVNPPGTYIKKSGDIFLESLDRCMITPSSVMLRKDLFDEAGGFNESLPACEDYDLWLRITSRYPAGLVDEYLLIRYGGHPDQLSATVHALDRFRVRALLDILAGNPVGPCTDHQRKLARSTLERKAMILANGYKKRGKAVEHERYNAIAKRFGG